jgi:hypothetical protein
MRGAALASSNRFRLEALFALDFGHDRIDLLHLSGIFGLGQKQPVNMLAHHRLQVGFEKVRLIVDPD